MDGIRNQRSNENGDGEIWEEPPKTRGKDENSMLIFSEMQFSCADTNGTARTNGVYAPDSMDFASSPQTATSSETSILDTQECSTNTGREARRTPTLVIDADRRPAHTHRRSTVLTARRGKPFVCKLIVFKPFVYSSNVLSVGN